MNEQQKIDPKLVLEDFFKILRQINNPAEWHDKIRFGYEILKKELEKQEK